jgi:hypothetical protein
MRLLHSFLIICIVATALPVSAQEDTGDFVIRVFGSDDIVAPTTPTLTSATPIATDQIDVVWTTATDNFVVSGYVISRDGLPLATTSLTTYSDTGLAASTTYTYSVRAFDPSFNYSSSSNLLSATTPDNPPTPVDPDSGNQSTASRVVLNELRIESGMSTTSFYIATARPARFEVRWGRTGAYELGYVVNDRYVSSYETTITDLEPGTTYEYEVVGYTQFGRAFVLEQGQFTTLGAKVFQAPANVNRFSAAQDGADVRLNWSLPFTDDLSSVRIVRSHLGFPTHLSDGAVVYIGRGTAVVDEDILARYSPVYYTAFVIDGAGNVSSGAVALVYAAGPGTGTTPAVPVPGGTPRPPVSTEDTAFASTSPALPANTRMPDVSEIFVTQNNVQKSFADKLLALNSTDSFTLSIPKDAVFESLKTIIVTLTDPTDSKKTYSFLLRINKDQTAYEAVLAPLMVEGISRVTIDIYDYKSAVVGTYIKSITFTDTGSQAVVPIFPDLLIEKGLPILLVATPLALISFLIFFFYRRRRHHDGG